MSQNQDLGVILTEILIEITQSFKKIMGVDRTTIFLVDPEDSEQCLILSNEGTHFIELRIPIYTGIGGIANLRKFANIPFEDRTYLTPSCIHHRYRKSTYITYNLLSLPLCNSQGTIIAFIQFINKLVPNADPRQALNERIDRHGFIKTDQKRFHQASAWMRSTAERCQLLYTELKKQRIVVSFIKAIHTITQGSLDLDGTIQLIMTETKDLIKADRTTLWLLDSQHPQLWTKIKVSDDEVKELHQPLDVGLVGKVARSGQPINIPFDLYIHPGSDTIKQLDRQTDYRTCSLLCMPIFHPDGKLLGVMELVNKNRSGHFPEYNPEHWPMPPERFKTSFSQGDQQLIAAFNVQVGIALQNAQLFAHLKQQEQIQRYIFSSLDKGVIYTDLKGRIITFNERARQILKIDQYEQIQNQPITNVIQIKGVKISQYLEEVLTQNRQFSYPNQRIITGTEEQNIDLLVNAIADNNNLHQVYGFLIVIRDTADNFSSDYRQISQNLTQAWLKEHQQKSAIQQDVSILCLDIRGYTNWVEEMEPEEVVNWVNQYFEGMVETVLTYQGTPHQYIGDALIAIFGSSLPLNDRAWFAVQTALKIRQRLPDFTSDNVNKPHQSLQIGIGIHSDKISCDDLNDDLNNSHEAINLTALLERTTQQYNCDIIMSETSYQTCKDRLFVRELDTIHVRTKKQPIAIYELVGLRSQPISEQQQQQIEHYHKGRDYYLNRQFALAMSEFSQVLAINSSDVAAIMQVQRCLHWLKSPPPKDWDGVWTVAET